MAFPIYWEYRTPRTELQIVLSYFRKVSRESGAVVSEWRLWSYAVNKQESAESFQFLGGLWLRKRADSKKIILFTRRFDDLSALRKSAGR